MQSKMAEQKKISLTSQFYFLECVLFDALNSFALKNLFYNWFKPNDHF